MLRRDFKSQLEVANVAKRFSSSAGEREFVKEQIKLGKSPADIEKQERVEQRTRDMGVDEDEAAAFAKNVKKARNTRETRKTKGAKNPGQERIIGKNDLLSSVFLERGAEATKSVCCIQENNVRIGTGFLVTPRVLLTNAHVIPDIQTAKRCHAEFNFEDLLVGVGIEPSIGFELAPNELFFSSPEDKLDYTLVAVAPTSGTNLLEAFKYLPLEVSVANALRGECLNILQHPDGAPKRVALRQNRFTALLDKFVHYESDTLPGSSGSPVFNDQWQVICLHHAGVPLKDSEGNILTVDNDIWDEDNDDPALIKWIGNEGIRISRIVADVIRRVKKKHGNLWPALLHGFPSKIDNPPHSDEKLVDIGDDDETDDDNDDNDLSTVACDDHDTSADNDDDAQTIDVKVSIGDGKPVIVKVPRGNRSSTSTSPSDSDDADDVSSDDDLGSASLVERGLRNLEASQKRKYYSEPKYAADRKEYYKNINPNSGTFAQDLRQLVTKTHKKQLSYKVARIEHLYAWVDLQRDKKVRSIYSDQKFDPKKFINDDFTIERRHERFAERRMMQEGKSSPEAMERLLVLLEAQDPFNCEHVVPQSWFGEARPMQGDLHHLFTCESKCNSFRGNLVYRDFGKFAVSLEAATKAKCGFSDSGQFEPFTGKGKVARATLYFLLRYKGQFVNQYDTEDEIETLLKWHEKTKVTEHELHRNQAIFGIQGNRNPFIDHPDWARKVFDV